MTEELKQAILNPTQKKRYQISAEYFSRGVANELKNKFNSPQLKDIEKIVGKIKKEKEVDEEKEKSKKSVIGKIAILSGLVISGVLLFKNLNNLFPDNKKQDTNISEEITYKLDETKIDNSTKELNETLRKSYIEGFSTPLIDGIKLLTSINPSTLGEELTRGLTEDQLLHNGIIGQVLYNITLAATWHIFERRGYEFILAAFDFPTAERVYFNVGMWRKYKADPTQYAHVGRDLVNNSIKGAEIVTETFENKDVILSQTITGQFMQTTKTILSLGSYVGETISNNYQDILTKLVMSKDDQDDLMRGRLSRNYEIIGARLLKMRRGQRGTGTYTTSGIGPTAPRQEILETVTVLDDTWKPFADYIDDWEEFDDGGLPPTIVRAPSEYTFINKQWDYVYEMYEFNKTNQTIQELLPTYKSLIRPANDKNKFWSMGDLARLVQLSYYAAEWELYQALQSINSTRGLYQEIFRKQQVDILTNKIAQRELELRRQAENFQIAYANGQIDVQEVVSRMKESILEISKKPLKWIENDIKFHSNSYKKQIPYINIKDMVGRIKREVLRLGVSGTKEENVLVLDNQSLRDNFDLRRRQNVDTNSNVQGQQFDKKTIRTSSNVYSDDIHADLYGINPYYKIAYWWGTWPGGTSLGNTKLIGQPGRGFGGELIFYGWRTYQREEEYKRFLEITDGDGDEARAWAEVAFDPSGYSLTKEFPEDSMVINKVRNPYHSTKHYASYDYVVRYTSFLGVNLINRYETYENGNFYLIDVCEYFDKENKFIGYREIKRKPSLKSHAAIYQGEYDTDKLDELYALPLESLERNLKDVADYVNQELLQAYEERNKLIEEIHEQCVVDSQDQNLRILIISK